MSGTENLNVTDKLRVKILQPLAVALGIVAGSLLLSRGLRGLFSFGINDNLFTFTGLLTSGFSLIPLSLVGIFRPRLAGKLIFTSVVLFLGSSLLYVAERRGSGKDSYYDSMLLMIFVPPSLLISALFWNAKDKSERTGEARREEKTDDAVKSDGANGGGRQ